jgi:N-acetylneuraminate synthase
MNLRNMMSQPIETFGDIYVIAEGGINHNGDINLAKQMIKQAADSGVDAIKFQKREVSLVYTDEFLNQPRESQWGATQRDQKNGLEFNQSEYIELYNYAKNFGLDFSASAWDLVSLNFIESLNPEFHKVASAFITNLEFLKSVASFMRPTFVSTGMCTYEDIDTAVAIFESANCPFMLLHSVSVYPAELSSLNLSMIQTLAKRYKRVVGYSGHEASVSPSLTAAAFGARAIERHFTLDRSMYGSDQSASLEPDGMRRLVAGLRKIPVIIGDGQKRYEVGEQEVAKKLRYWQ